MTAFSPVHHGMLERLVSLLSSHHEPSEPFGTRIVMVPGRTTLFDPNQFLRNLVEDHKATVLGFEQGNFPFLSSESSVPARPFGMAPMNVDMTGGDIKQFLPKWLSNPSRFAHVAWFIEQVVWNKDRSLRPQPDFSLVFLIEGNDGLRYTVVLNSDEEPFNPGWLVIIGRFSDSDSWAAESQLVYPV